MNKSTIAVNLRPLYPGKIGGLETYARYLLDRWILGPVGKDVSWILFTNEANHNSFDHCEGRCRRILLPNADFESFLVNRLLEYQPDMYFCPFLTLEPLNPPCPSAVTIPDLQHEFFPQFFSEEILSWRRKNYAASTQRATCVFTVSEHSKRTFMEKLGIEPEKITVIPHDIDDSFHHELDPAELDRVRKSYSLPEKYIFYPANFWPHKNHEKLLLALARAGRKLESLQLILTGARDERLDLLLRLARELGVDARVRYAGYVPRSDLPYFYAGAQALVFPSLYEGFGIPIAEAFCCGCPVICSNTTSCPEAARDAAVLVDPVNEAEIAEAIERVCTDVSTREQLIRAGRQQKSRFAGNREAEATLQRLLAVVAAKRSRSAAHPLPRISVITPSFNQAEFIGATIQSVLAQDYPDLEYRVIDGGSSDGTVEILRSYGDRLLWVSERDRGQADAVNKGFLQATGEIVGWLNSDDTYLPGTLTYVGEFFADHAEVDVIYGDGYYIDRAGKILSAYRTYDYRWETLAHECYICQPTVFFRRKVLQDVGLLDTNMHVALDYEFWLRLFRRHSPVRLPRFLATSRMYVENKTLSQRKSAYRETMNAVRKHFGYIPYSWIFGYASYLHHRNDQFHDPARTSHVEVVMAIFMMAWYNRSNPRYFWWWITNKQYGMYSEVIRSARPRQATNPRSP